MTRYFDRPSVRALVKRAGASVSYLALTLGSIMGARAQGDLSAATAESASSLDPNLLLTGGSMAFAVAAALWATRVAWSTRSATVDWSRKLARMEAKYELSESILASHPGLVLVWDDTLEDLETGWGRPRVFGGSAALASLLAFASDDPAAFLNPADALLSALGDLPLEGDEERKTAPSLQQKVHALRTHGVTFSGAVITEEGRAIECDGRVAGTQVTLWLTDPAARLADEAGVVGSARDKAADLHGALNQLDRAPTVCWRRGADLSIEWVNNAYIEMVEAINLQEVIDEQIEISPEFRQVAEKARANSGRPADGIVKVNVKGQRKVLRVIETPMHRAGGASSGGMAIDITRQERAQDDLKRQQLSHRKTLDQISAGVAVFNGAQQLEYYNQSFLDLWGLAEADLRTRPGHGELLDKLRDLGKLPAQDTFSQWKAQQLRLYTEDQGEGASATEGAMPDEIWDLPDGRTVRVRQERHATGGVSVAFEDRTQIISLQSRYQTQISVQRATLNDIAQGVAVFNTDGRLALHNRSFEEMWELSRDQLEGSPHIDELRSSMQTKTENGEAIFVELKKHIVSFSLDMRKPYDGDELALSGGRILLPATTPLPDGNTLVTFLDITDAKEREHYLETRNQVLEDADRIKSRFVNHISYQLRNPLNTIIGFSEMLEGEMIGQLTEKQKDYATTILTAGNHLLDLVNDIIDLAAIDAGRLGLDMEEVDIRELLESAATFAALKAEDSQINLRVDCDKSIGILRADERRLKQVLFNLLANAFTFTSPGGEVILGARRDGQVVRLWVEDTGRGVSPQDQANVFNRFESAGPGAGVGLGLALVNSFIELHGGFVRMESQEGAGTLVTCHLPADGPQDGSLRDPDAIISSISAALLLEEGDADRSSPRGSVSAAAE